MTQSFREAIQAAARAEPAVGDPYERFVRRRRRSRGMRTLLGVVLASLTMIGFVRIFPGGVGVAPNDGFFPGNEVQPGFEEYQRFHAEPLALTIDVPRAWSTRSGSTSARVAAPDDAVEIRFGAIGGCRVEECVPIATALERPDLLRELGVRTEPETLRIGSLSASVTEIRFPSTPTTAIAPSCAGCLGFYGEIGTSRLPMLILTREAALREHADLLDEILRTIQVG